MTRSTVNLLSNNVTRLALVIGLVTVILLASYPLIVHEPPRTTVSTTTSGTTARVSVGTGTPSPKSSANTTSFLSEGTIRTYSVTNPTTNARLHVQAFLPEDGIGRNYTALVLVPGGLGDSRGLIDDATRMASAGIVAVIFDPDGRGRSAGQEDYGGERQQDGLAAVIRFTAALPEVDSKKIGVATYSYGITMGSGVLARHTDLPVKFLIDWEGPADRNYTTIGCRSEVAVGRISWQPCTNNAWWSEREAVGFIGKVRVPYQRIQSEKDHVQPNNNHAIDMINAAIKGGSPFVRLNDYPPNQTYDQKSPPQMLPERMDRQLVEVVIRYAQELFIAENSTTQTRMQGFPTWTSTQSTQRQ